jgi:hypothetical protein
MKMRFKTVKAFTVVVVMAAFLTTQKAEARPPRARQVVAVVQAINCDKRTLSLNYPQGRGPRELIWNSATKFLRDWKFVPAAELKNGTQATVYYHSPFFGKPFATKVVWNAR